MIQIEEKPVIFKNSEGKRLWGVLSLPGKEKKAPAVIIAHGFNGSKSNRKFVAIGRKFAQYGIATLRFDFSGCGDSEGNFENMKISQEVDDLKAAYKFLTKQPTIDKKRIGLLGHSLGTLIVSLFQIKTSLAKTLVLIALALDQKSLMKIWYSPKEIKKWQKQGYFDTPKYRIGAQYLNEAKDYTPVANNINIPTLIIHGDKDKDVPLRFSRRLFRFFRGKRKMIIIKKADHDFESYQVLKELINYSLKWLKKTL
jgi:dipeptidyl aminopeptidase/acylaminoacyl peptidase